MQSDQDAVRCVVIVFYRADLQDQRGRSGGYIRLPFYDHGKVPSESTEVPTADLCGCWQGTEQVGAAGVN